MQEFPRKTGQISPQKGWNLACFCAIMDLSLGQKGHYCAYTPRETAKMVSDSARSGRQNTPNRGLSLERISEISGDAREAKGLESLIPRSLPTRTREENQVDAMRELADAVVSLHRQAHGEEPFRICQEIPCRQVGYLIAGKDSVEPSPTFAGMPWNG